MFDALRLTLAFCAAAMCVVKGPQGVVSDGGAAATVAMRSWLPLPGAAAGGGSGGGFAAASAAGGVAGDPGEAVGPL